MGRSFELLTVRQTWGEDRVYFYDDAGELKALPARWTDAGALDPFVVIAAGRAYFRAADLLALADVLEGLSKRDSPDARRAKC